MQLPEILTHLPRISIKTTKYLFFKPFKKIFRI